MKNENSKNRQVLIYILVLLVEIMIIGALLFAIAYYTMPAEKETSSTIKPTPLILQVPNSSDKIVIEETLQDEKTVVEETSNVITETLRYNFTDADIYLLATLLCGSKNVNGDGEYDFDYGNDERFDQISLILCVVMNRVRDERFPNTVEEVVCANDGHVWQFHVMKQWNNTRCEVSDIALQRISEWCYAYNNNAIWAQTIPEDHVYFYGDGKENHSSS